MACIHTYICTYVSTCKRNTVEYKKLSVTDKPTSHPHLPSLLPISVGADASVMVVWFFSSINNIMFCGLLYFTSNQF